MKHRPLKQLCGLLATAAIALVLVGCNGKAGQNGTNGTSGTNGANGAPGATYATDVTTLTPDEWAGLTLKGQITKVTMGTKPVVTFTVTDGHNVPVKGFGQFTTKTATAQYASYGNLGFAVAKLVPGTAGSPDRWVSYIVTGNPTAAAPTAWNPTKPTTDNIGTLVDNGDGTYVYTFGRDISQAAAQLAAYTYDATKNQIATDLDDVSYQPTLTHRLTLFVGGLARGTGSAAAGDPVYIAPNTPNGADSGVKGVYILNPANTVYDFIPSTGAVVGATDLQREIVSVDKCFTCHAKFEFHGGGRQDTRYCMVCHNDQRKYSVKDAVVTGTAAAGDLTVTGEAGKFRGLATGDFPSFIHRLHRGESTEVKGYGYAGLAFDARYPQNLKNCVKCHTASTVTPQGDNWSTKPSRMACGGCHDMVNWVTGDGHNAVNNAPTPQLSDTNCSGCHTAAYIKLDHIPVTPPNTNSAWHILGGNPNTNASFIAPYTDNLPVGAKVITWDLKSVTLNPSQQPVFTFRFLDSTPSPAVPLTFTAAPAVSTATQELLPAFADGSAFVGGPSVYLSFAVPQDGITTPADPNGAVSGYIRNIWNKSAVTNIAVPPAAANNVPTGTMTGPDASGYYTLTLTAVKVPTTATMITGGIGYTYGLTATQPLTQTANVTGFPWLPNFYAYTPRVSNTPSTGIGGLTVPAPNVWKLVSGTLPAGFVPQAARRKIVDNARCNACHGKMGTFTEAAFHAGQRNDVDTCVWCHTTDRVNSGWGVNIKDAVHAIHGAGKRVNKYSWEAANSYNPPTNNSGATYWETTYPSPLNNCEICHVPGSYDFENVQSLGAVPNLLWTTVATADSTTVTANTTTVTATAPYSATGVVIKTGTETILPTDKVLSPFITPGTNYGAGFVMNFSIGNTGATSVEATGTTLVNSPYVGACTGCHDTNIALDHMRTNGGSFYATRSSVIDPTTSTFDVKKQEQCFLCHSAGKVADVQKVHMTFK